MSSACAIHLTPLDPQAVAVLVASNTAQHEEDPEKQESMAGKEQDKAHTK